MRKHRTAVCLGGAVAFITCLAFATPASAAATTLIFKEPEKGSTVAFVDNPPKSLLVRGTPKVSAGDEIIFTNFLEAEGKVVGKIRAFCTATETVSLKNADADGFICTALAKIPGGTLALVAPLSGIEGVVTGGTGKYAGAQGSFVVKQGRGSDTNTITLLE
ncbi:MAG TPA: hypothetical protein VHU86_07580 [Solirubrobacterales bacterium]|nr:hypothetical protein [Solirubrobacterales bacterium]